MKNVIRNRYIVLKFQRCVLLNVNQKQNEIYLFLSKIKIKLKYLEIIVHN